MNYFIDLHQDLLLYISRPELYKDTSQTSFEKLLQNNFKIVVASAFPVPENEEWFDPNLPNLIEQDLLAYNAYVEKHPEWIIITSVAELDRVMKTDGLHGLILHIEGLNVFDETSGWDRLENWYKLGLRSIGPVWNHRNPFGGGTLDETGGLTELGKALIRWCEKRGVLLDCAHMNSQTFWDTTETISRPVLISHGNSSAICDDIRNYTDEQIKKVGSTGGVIGFFLSKKFITKNLTATQADVRAHIDHIVALAGPQGIAIGSDYGGILSGFPIGMEGVDSLPLFIQTLTDISLVDVSYKNALRVIRAHLTPINKS